MNSLNLLSSRVIGSSAADDSQSHRQRSYSEGNLGSLNVDSKPKRSASQRATRVTAVQLGDDETRSSIEKNDSDIDIKAEEEDLDEKTPLLRSSEPFTKPNGGHSKPHAWTKRLVDAVTASLQWILSSLIAPGEFVVRAFYTEDGRFAVSMPLRKLSRISFGRQRSKQNKSEKAGYYTKSSNEGSRRLKSKDVIKRKGLKSTANANATSESEEDYDEKYGKREREIGDRQRPLTSSSSEETPQIRRSTRLRSQNEDTTRRRKQPTRNSNSSHLTAENIKSPTSPGSSLRLTNFPHAPLPPRPLIPARQPSYTMQLPKSSRFSQKTLVIDLDETLIHSMAKGGRMSSGHMVEVKLNTSVGVGGATIGPQHPILYYVHKRPHCDDFLRRVCKWYNLVVFTASVQEYADPVIDWLEQERKYFSGRFYRQHCTFRNGAYIKDLSSVESDLSKVMILDNSPLSYIFHEGTSH